MEEEMKMLNQNIIVGRIANDPVLLENKDNEKYNTITIAVPRNYKNKNSEYDIDFINVLLTKMISENTSQYCKKGDVIGTWFPDRQYKGKSCILSLIYNINLIIYHNLLFVNK